MNKFKSYSIKDFYTINLFIYIFDLSIIEPIF